MLLFGPSDEVDTRPIHAVDKAGNWFDDHLTKNDIDVICGVYTVKVVRNGTAVKQWSWWPTPDVWANSGLDCGYWSGEAEKKFLNRKASILRARTTPIPDSNTWRKNLKFMDQRLKATVGAAESACEILLKSISH